MHCMQQPSSVQQLGACDGCDAWYHFECTSLEAMPGAQGQWLCEECLNCEDFYFMLNCTDCHQHTEKSIN